jgi:uncharacterized protein (DUF1501 family)
MAIWHTARFDPEEHKGYGWLGRALDATAGMSILVNGGDIPTSLRGRRSAAVALTRPEDLVLQDAAIARQAVSPGAGDDLLDFVRRQATDGFVAAQKMANVVLGSDAVYPGSVLAERLKLTARLLKSDLSARVFYTQHGTYDTHAAQQFTHANLLREFAGAVSAFFVDLSEAKLADRVVLLAFSEFGRTIKANGSAGTDHGTAGCVFLAGPSVKGGLIGTMPSLTDLSGGEPKMTMDFRRLYATLLDGWLSCASEQVLGAKFEAVAVL